MLKSAVFIFIKGEEYEWTDENVRIQYVIFLENVPLNIISQRIKRISKWNEHHFFNDPKKVVRLFKLMKFQMVRNMLLHCYELKRRKIKIQKILLYLIWCYFKIKT